MVFSSYQLHHVSVKTILETIMIAHKNSSVLHTNILWRMAMKGFIKALISAFNHLQKGATTAHFIMSEYSIYNVLVLWVWQP
jgi:hypothetical protein